MAMISQTQQTLHQRSMLKAAAARSAAISPATVGDLVSRKIEKAAQLRLGMTRQSPPTRRPAPQSAKPFGAGVLVYATPSRHDDRDDDGSLSPSARNGKPSDSVPYADQREWAATSAASEAREQARETVAEWREESSRREIMNEIDLACSRYEISANLSGFISEW